MIYEVLIIRVTIKYIKYVKSSKVIANEAHLET